VSIYRNFSHKILERLDSGAIDVGIVTLPVKMPMLKLRTIFRDRLVLMVSADNPLAQHDKVPISMVVEQPLILPRTGFTRRIMDKLFRPYRDKLHVRMELPSIGMIKSFVAAGLGVSLISESFARDEVQSGKVKLIALKDNELSRELGLAYRRNRSLPRAAEVFIELLQRRTTQSGQKTALRTS
jgi:DNA-binding transcriptional LysR family regulator